MALPTAEQVTNHFLYGQSTTPVNLATEDLIRPALGPGEFGSSIPIDVNDFMSDGAEGSAPGPGRFALGASFDLVKLFFSSTPSGLPPGTYTKQQLATEFGIQEVGGSTPPGSTNSSRISLIVVRFRSWSHPRARALTLLAAVPISG